MEERKIKKAFESSENLLEVIKEADRITKEKHGSLVSVQRAIFLAWYCAKADCKFCYIYTKREKMKDALKERRRKERIFAEAYICRALNWDIEFLSGGYECYSLDEVKKMVNDISRITGQKLWLNIGYMKEEDLRYLAENSNICGIVGSVETINDKLRKELCPSKPLKAIEKTLSYADKLGIKKGITIILGLGESIYDLPELFNFIKKHEINRITYYSLNPHKNTPLENYPSPASLYHAGVIALTRLEFPEIEIIGGTGLDQLSDIGIILLAGANAITKYPLLEVVGTRYGKKIEEEVKFAGRKLKGSFTDLKKLERIKDKIEDERVKREFLIYIEQIKKKARKTEF